jgi:hypothetical protein
MSLKRGGFAMGNRKRVVDDKWGKKNEGEYSIWLDYKHEVIRRSFWGKCQVSFPFKVPCIGKRSHRQNTRCDK